MSDDQLQSAADLIVTGYVTHVAEQDEVRYPAPRQKLVVGHWTVTLEVEKVKKGHLPPGITSIDFTAERILARPKGWMGGTDTMRVDPLFAGDGMKVYLAR